MSKFYMVLVFIFLYAPIAVMAVFSFNESVSTYEFTDFSLKWWKEMFSNSAAMDALKNTIILAVVSCSEYSSFQTSSSSPFRSLLSFFPGEIALFPSAARNRAVRNTGDCAAGNTYRAGRAGLHTGATLFTVILIQDVDHPTLAGNSVLVAGIHTFGTAGAHRRIDVIAHELPTSMARANPLSDMGLNLLAKGCQSVQHGVGRRLAHAAARLGLHKPTQKGQLLQIRGARLLAGDIGQDQVHLIRPLPAEYAAAAGAVTQFPGQTNQHVHDTLLRADRI